MRRLINFYFVSPPLMLREPRRLEVRTRRDGSEYVIARTAKGKRVRVTLDEPDAIFITKG